MKYQRVKNFSKTLLIYLQPIFSVYSMCEIVKKHVQAVIVKKSNNKWL